MQRNYIIEYKIKKGLIDQKKLADINDKREKEIIKSFKTNPKPIIIHTSITLDKLI